MKGIKAGSEDEIQANFFVWASLNSVKYPQLLSLYAVPNGGVRHKMTAIRMKATGAKRGVPDVHLPVSRGDYSGLFIEFKVGNCVMSDDQREWATRLISYGHKVVVCKDWKTAADMVIAYLNNKPVESVESLCRKCNESIWLHPEMCYDEPATIKCKRFEAQSNITKVF